MVNQLLAGVHIASGAEAMAFGARLGINTRMLFDVITNSGGTSWYATLYCSSYYCWNLSFNLSLIWFNLLCLLKCEALFSNLYLTVLWEKFPLEDMMVLVWFYSPVALSTYEQFFNMTLETGLLFLDSTCFTCLVITVFGLFSWLENISHIGLSFFFWPSHDRGCERDKFHIGWVWSWLWNYVLVRLLHILA